MKDRCVSFVKNILVNHHFKLIILALIVSLPALVFSDIPVSHDILFHLSRIDGIKSELEMGNMFSFIYHNFLHNLGYASPLFYPDLFLYPFALLYKFFNLSTIYKILMISINLATVYSIDFVLHKITDNLKIISFGTILYTFTSYRMVDMYARGCLGEALTFIFIPLVILGMYELVNGNRKKYYYLVIGMTGIIYSHIISTFLVGILIFFYLLLNLSKIFKDKRWAYLLWSVLLTFFLTCSFLLPFLEQLVDRDFYIHYLDQTSTYNNIFVPFYKWFLEIPLPSNVWLPLGIGIIYLYFIFLGFKYRKQLKYVDVVWLILGFFFLLCTTSLVPRFVYDNFLYLIQYQWRFFMLATVSLFFFGIIIMKKVSSSEMIIIKKVVFCSSIVLLTVMISNNIIYKKVNYLDSEYLGFYEYLPKGVLLEDVIDYNISSNANNIIDYEYNFIEDKLVLKYYNNHYSNTVIILPILYYKGYTTNKNYDIINSSGLVGVKLEQESDEVVIYYEGTNISYISRTITLITILLLVCFYIRKKGLYDEVKQGI